LEAISKNYSLIANNSLEFNEDCLLLSLLKDIFLLLKAMFKNHSLIANDS
jgi:hypothetical protein